MVELGFLKKWYLSAKTRIVVVTLVIIVITFFILGNIVFIINSFSISVENDHSLALIVGYKNHHFYSNMHNIMSHYYDEIDVKDELQTDSESNLEKYDLITLISGNRPEYNSVLQPYVESGGRLLVTGAEILYFRQNSSSLKVPTWLGVENYTNGGYADAIVLQDNPLGSYLPNQTTIYRNPRNNWSAAVEGLVKDDDPKTALHILSRWYNSSGIPYINSTVGPIYSYSKEWLTTNGKLLYVSSAGYIEGEGTSEIWRKHKRFLSAGLAWFSGEMKIHGVIPQDAITRSTFELKPYTFFGNTSNGEFSQIDVPCQSIKKISALDKRIILTLRVKSSQALVELPFKPYIVNKTCSIDQNHESNQVVVGTWHQNTSNLHAIEGVLGYLGSFTADGNGITYNWDITSLFITGEVSDIFRLIIENTSEYDIILEEIDVITVNFPENQANTLLIVLFSLLILLISLIFLINIVIESIVDLKDQTNSLKTLTKSEMASSLMSKQTLIEIKQIFKIIDIFDISINELLILLVITSKEEKKVPISVIKESLEIDYNLLNYRLKKLIDKGLVKKSTGLKGDARKRVCSITESGMMIIAELNELA